MSMSDRGSPRIPLCKKPCANGWFLPRMGELAVSKDEGCLNAVSALVVVVTAGAMSSPSQSKDISNAEDSGAG